MFLRGRKLFNTFISQSYFEVPNTIKLNVTHYFIMKIPNKIKLQQIALNYSSDTELMLSFSVMNTTSSSDNPLRFRKNLLKHNC